MAQNNPTVMYSPYGKSINGQNPKNYKEQTSKKDTGNSNLGNSFLGPSQNPNPTSTNKNYDSFFNMSGTGSSDKNPLDFTNTKQQWQVGDRGSVKPAYAPGVTSIQDFADIIGGDIKRQEQANKLNFQKNMGAANDAKNIGMAGVDRMLDSSQNGESFFGDAENYLKAGQQQAKDSSAKFNKQLDKANQDQQNATNKAMGMSNAAINTSQQGSDQQASAIQNAMARNNENQNDQIANQMSGSLPGTESQINEMQRFQSGESKRQATSAIAGLQDQQITRTANLQAAKAQTFAQLSASNAALKNLSLNQGQASEQNYIQYNNHLAALSQAHGVMRQQAAQTAAQLGASIGSNYAQMIIGSPLQAINVASSVLTLNEYQARYNPNQYNPLPYSISTSQPNGEPGSINTAQEYMRKNKLANASTQGGYGTSNLESPYAYSYNNIHSAGSGGQVR